MKPRNAYKDPLADAGLVVVSLCGHWLTYSTRGTAEHLHDIACFNAGFGCSICRTPETERQETGPDGPVLRVN
jgi:hypothetical protein